MQALNDFLDSVVPTSVARTILHIAWAIRGMSFGILVFLCVMVLFQLERIYREERVVVYRRRIRKLSERPAPHSTWRLKRVGRLNRKVDTHQRHLWQKRHFM